MFFIGGKEGFEGLDIVVVYYGIISEDKICLYKNQGWIYVLFVFNIVSDKISDYICGWC